MMCLSYSSGTVKLIFFWGRSAGYVTSLRSKLYEKEKEEKYDSLK